MMDLEIADYERTVQTLNAQIADRDSKLCEKDEEVRRIEETVNSLKKQLGMADTMYSKCILIMFYRTVSTRIRTMRSILSKICCRHCRGPVPSGRRPGK